MAKAPLDSDVRRLPVTIGLLAGVVVSLGTIFSATVWFESWVDDRVNAGVRNYSYELIFPRVESLESSNKRILIMLEAQESTQSKRHDETKELLKRIMGRQ